MSESDIQKQILDWLEVRNAFPCLLGRKGKARYTSRYMRSGLPDIFCVFKNKAVFIEVKRPKGVVSDEQIQFIHELISRGITAFIAESLEDVIQMLEPN